MRVFNCFLALLLVFATASTSLGAAGTGARTAATKVNWSNTQSVNLDFDLAGLQTKQVETADGLRASYVLPDEGTTYEYGKPMLPAITRYLIVPPDCGLELVVEADDPDHVSADDSPLLCLDPELPEAKEGAPALGSQLYPTAFAEMSAPEVMRGFRLVRITTYPIQYDPVKREFLVRNHINADVRFTNDRAVNPVEAPNRKHVSRIFLKALRSLAANADEVLRDDVVGEPPPYVGHYLVATHEDCLPYAAPWIEFRRKSGYKMDILSLTSQQAGSYSTVKTEIKKRYEEYTEAGEDPFDLVLLIGDRSGYSNYSGSPGSQLAAPVGTSNWSSPEHDDWDYACLDGNDRTADVGISRWCAGDKNTMNLFVGRTMAYEAEPNMDDTSWFERAGVFSQHWGNGESSAWHITIHTNVRWAEELLQAKGLDSVRTFENYVWDQYGDKSGPFEIGLYNDGASMILARAENYYFYHRTGLSELHEQTVFPIRIVTCGHGEWTTWGLLRYGAVDGRNILVGPVASTCGWGGPVTGAMTVVWLEMVSGIVADDLPLGWGRVMGLMSPEIYIPNFANSYSWAKTDVDCYGDPGLQPWLGTPRMVEFDAPAAVTPETRLVELFIHRQGSEDPVPGAQATIYINGDMPAPEDGDDERDDYAAYDGMSMATGTSDAAGKIHFMLEDGALAANDTLFITVSGRDIRPYFTSAPVTAPQHSCDLSEFTLDETAGNDDGDVNPGEVLALNLTALNNGTDALFAVTGVVTSLSPWVEVDDNQINFGDLASGGTAGGDTAAVLRISNSCPDGVSRPITRPDIAIEFSSEGESWRTGIKLNPVAPDLEVRSLINGGLVELQERDLDIDIDNFGGFDAPAMEVRLVSNGPGINIIHGRSEYDRIAVGGHDRLSGDPFTVSADSSTIPGVFRQMALVFSSGGVVFDSSFFELQVRQSGANMPLGPDKYGYVCYDDTDTLWALHPEFDWIEISTKEQDRDFNGENVPFDSLRDTELVGKACVLDLGFPTQFYGREYEQITVTTNGFICLGEQPRITNYVNWPMDRAIGGGAGMIAPFWDDLRRNDNSGIYYYNDAEDHKFIVEWYKLKPASGDSLQTFQVIIYDKRYWITPSGDPMILMQYDHISNLKNIRAGDTEWTDNCPYASVGISSPDGTTGINYTFNRIYPDAAAPLTARRAILFATSSQSFKSGFLDGYVTDARTGLPMENSAVSTSYGFSTLTDADGYWFMNEALADIGFTITASKIAYNDSTSSSQLIGENDSTQVDFALLHPEFTPSTIMISAAVDSGMSLELPLEITNTGNGPLKWSVERRLPRGADVDPWMERLSYNVGQVVGDSRIEGVAFANGKMFISGGSGGEDNSLNYIYVFDRDMTMVDQFPQPDPSGNYGITDLDWDGQLIWGGFKDTLYGIDPTGVVATSFKCDLTPIQAVAWDPDRQILWVAKITGRDIYGYDRLGQQVATIPQSGINIFGLAYWPEDPDHHQLYAFNSLATQVVTKINPEDGDTIYVGTLNPVGGGSPRGATITNQYDVYSWVFLSVSNNAADDRVDVWQLAARRDWFLLDTVDDTVRGEATFGVINAGVTQPYTLKFNAIDLPKLQFDGFLQFRHNALGMENRIDVSLQIIGAELPSPFSLFHPANGDTLDSLLTVFAWNPTIDRNLGSIPSYELFAQTQDSTVSFVTEATALTVDLATTGLPISPDNPFTWWVRAVSAPDTVISTEQFSFWISATDLRDPNSKPVEFGLSSIYPSPFNSMTGIQIGVDRESHTRLRVYDMQGREVATLLDGTPPVGYHRIVWDASRMPSGIYIVRLENDGRVRTAKLALMR